MLTKLNNKCVKAVLQMNLIQCFQCTHTPITIKIQEAYPPPPPTPRVREGWVGTRTALWSTEKSLPLPGIKKSLPLPGIKLRCHSCQTFGLLNTSTMLSQLWYLHPSKL
jgi:hypothetical protein